MTIRMNGTKQLEREVRTTLTVASLWAVLADARLLPRWAGVVDRVESCEAGGEHVGAVRRCAVRLGGRAGRVVERCVAVVPGRSIAYLVDEDSFGISRMFEHYGFRISLAAVDDGTTRIRIETFYTPRNHFFAILNTLVLRRRFRKVVDELLAGLVRFASSREMRDNVPQAVAVAG